MVGWLSGKLYEGVPLPGYLAISVLFFNNLFRFKLSNASF